MLVKTDRLSISLEDILPSNRFILREVNPVFIYENKQRTDKIWGYKYKLVDTQVFEIFEVKVESKTPLVTQQTIDNSDPIWVALDSAIVKPNKIEFGKAQCSVTAQNITILKE